MDLIEKAKQTWISATQFGKLIGASRQAVSKAIENQRLWNSVRSWDCGERTRHYVNIYYGLKEWQENTDPSRPDTKQIDIHAVLLSRWSNVEY